MKTQKGVRLIGAKKRKVDSEEEGDNCRDRVRRELTEEETKANVQKTCIKNMEREINK